MSQHESPVALGDGVFRIRRGLEPGTCRLADVFPDICACAVLNEIFPGAGEIDRVLARIRVFVADMPHEMFVDNNDGSITIGLNHLRNASDTFLYLDIVHELFHVRQQTEGRNLYDRSKSYVDRETEIEAYRLTVREARRIGLDDEAIACYLRVSWITAEEHGRLLRTLGVSEGG
jgi:hypothetical protein